ncbi:hypothetical protein ACGF12_33135 [Kitasatospora sp. NPDC048296]|uniref:hypothetical protein n=1 Tax=Kitasatospora sp. NPDC048296 TaxID=3364048 RepID=UPI0037248BF2
MYAVEQAVRAELADRLGGLGWDLIDEDHEVVVFSLQRDADQELVWHLGVSFGGRGASLRLSPVLGVQHPATSRLVTLFNGLPGQEAGGLCSFGIPLSELIPRRAGESLALPRWAVRREGEAGMTVAALCTDLRSVGLPFFEPFRTLESLIRRLSIESRYQVMSGHLAVARALAGDIPGAESALAEYARTAAHQQGLMLTATHQFVSGFVGHFGFGAEVATAIPGA